MTLPHRAPPPLPQPSRIPHVYYDGWGRYWTATPGTPEAKGPPHSLRRWWARKRAEKTA